MNICLVPATPQNVAATITQSVPWNILKQHLDEPDYKRLERSLNSAPVHCWAVTKNRRAFYENLNDGDAVLLTVKETGTFNYFAEVADTVHSLRFGNYLWPLVGTYPWEYIYFLKNIRPISKSKVDIVCALGYPASYQVCGSITANRAAVAKVLRQYGSVEAFLEAMPNGKGSPLPRPLSGKSQTVSSQAPPVFITPTGFEPLIARIYRLRIDQHHHERDHESLVETFYELMGYQRTTEIRYRQGRVDITVCKDQQAYIVNEVKRDWGLLRKDPKVLQQAYGYAQQLGVA